MAGSDILIGIDAGTSVIKAVAFDLAGRQIASAAVPNRYETAADGSATQPLGQTWEDCARALRQLGELVEGLSSRTAALAVTGQGDGTWLAGKGNRAVGDAWLWLDARAAPTVDRLAACAANRARFEATGTGLNTCQMGSQIAHMQNFCPEMLQSAEVALHCKDWLYLNLTGVRATDPSEASFTFGNYRNRQYDDTVIAALGLERQRHLLPPIIEGTETTHPLCPEAAAATGLRAGTPVSLGYVDMVMTALGAGVYGGGGQDVACSTVGSTGVHMRAVRWQDVHLNDEGTGYVICLPVPGVVTQVQTNMAATLNVDWALGLAGDALRAFGHEVSHKELVVRIDAWLGESQPGQIVYHPYISEAGERGPFVNALARAGFTGFSQYHGFADLLRAVTEGLGHAMRDCYTAMGKLPGELRLTGGAARSAALRQIFAASVDAPVRVSQRDEAGAAGAAMMAAVAIGAYKSMDDCVNEWVIPLLGQPEAPDQALVAAYSRIFPAYQSARQVLVPVWDQLSRARRPSGE
ncbi:carbohydrate kinase [Xinfangfangia sp. D13-10-4-6]|uniref:FGGY-family carbohydrate kinase n=1 Tax=Pseudogemmobacter hezensis TaxID=2737662 RepID=UPI001551E402|nr:FGGY-family carbohydrate kinase [Pseudogemmobacter hezensis]NPD16537.1 carbohydrate kinase [Pseudogemmobacter hezensis]